MEKKQGKETDSMGDLSVCVRSLSSLSGIALDQANGVCIHLKVDEEKWSQTTKLQSGTTPAFNESFSLSRSLQIPILVVEMKDSEGKVLATGTVIVESMKLNSEIKTTLSLTDDKNTTIGTLEMTVKFRPGPAHPMGLKFFSSLGDKVKRDYIVIVDKSGSMSGGNWRDAKQALSYLAKPVCEADPDGITVYFFSNSTTKYENVKTPEAVEKLFSDVSPSGGTDLTGALQTAFDEFFFTKKQTTILVITDGAPNDPSSVMTTIQNASNKLEKDEDLSVSFIQVGRDSSASQFLKRLDDDLTCKFDIVDTLSVEGMKNMSFTDVIQRSIAD
eukprot:TRINITY_DN1324_c1_g1_i1.p1 TRINITY_DN1324_c1_g1~~TRINITY_DN1324_c1_g1_i1.p1  ORF type:complete len:357 (+),score=123.96 TRINITY_DN1324_c1_g1_i1:83-1072(+)